MSDEKPEPNRIFFRFEPGQLHYLERRPRLRGRKPDRLPHCQDCEFWIEVEVSPEDFAPDPQGGPVPEVGPPEERPEILEMGECHAEPPVHPGLLSEDDDPWVVTPAKWWCGRGKRRDGKKPEKGPRVSSS